MVPRSAFALLGAALLLVYCTWDSGLPAGTLTLQASPHRLFLLPMTGVQTWRAAPRAWSSGPVAQLAPAPVKRPGIARPGIAKPKRERPKPKPAQERNRQKKEVKKKITKRVVEEKEQPPYRVMLLGDEDYEEEHVVISMRAIVDELKQDGKRATQIFEQAQKNGRELITIAPQDVAEMYAQKLTHSIPIIYAVAEKAE